MIERELTHRLWVSSRFLWAMKWAGPAVFAIYGVGLYGLQYWPIEYHGWVIAALLIAIPRSIGWVGFMAYVGRAADVILQGEELWVRRKGRVESVSLTDGVELSKIGHLPNWFAKVSRPGAMRSGSEVSHTFLWYLLSMFASPNSHEEFELWWNTPNSHGRRVRFIHPARFVEGDGPYQEGMQTLVQRLESLEKARAASV